MVLINQVGPTLAQRDTWKRMVGITLAYARLVGLRALDQHRINGWRLSWPYEQNDIGPTPFVDVGPTKLPTKCQRWPNKWLLSGYYISYFLRNFEVEDEWKKIEYWYTITGIISFMLSLQNILFQIIFNYAIKINS